MTSKYEPTATDWIETVSGKHFPFLDPQSDDIDIKDIAFSLANQCRFNGHVPFFSVAEHSVAVAARLPAHLQLAGLLHDAAEAYVSDIPSPVKRYLPDYKVIENKIQAAVNAKFGIDSYDAAVKDADAKAVSNEAYYLIKSKGKDWSPVFFTPEPKYQPRCLNPMDSFKLFMTWYTDLTTEKTAATSLIERGFQMP